MSLAPGTRLGVYEVTSQLGAGGMGEVYRAHDTKLGRDVALKVVLEALVEDADRAARFQREARSLAALNHPNIATLHGMEEVDSRHFLVMELVEGDDLSVRIAQGAIPLDQALPIARQIADALEAAHETGIIHRDLKPANVKVKDDGTVKVLDFGLAKAMDPDSGPGTQDPSNSPTLTARATQMGMIIGTAAYMSPEQARGRAVDRRADIWAFGVVLFEMLTGQRAFDGDDISITLASVLKEDVHWQALPADLPVPIRRLLRRCLEKDPKRRLSSIGDARLELDEAGAPADRDGAIASTSAPLAAAVAVPAWRRALPWAAAALVVGLAAGWLVRGTPPLPPESRVLLAAESTAVGLDGLAMSPDGTQVAENGPNGIRIRSLGDIAWRQLPDTQGASVLTFDNTGTRLYFSRGTEVLSMGADGSSPLVDATFEAGTQIYSLYRGVAGDVQASTWLRETRIVRIPAGGGMEELWRGQLDASSRLVATTELATGRWITWVGTPAGSNGLVVVGAAMSEPLLVLAGYRHALHVGDGEVLTVDDRGRLASARFDVATGAVLAPPVVRVDGLALLGGVAPAYDVADNRTLAYVAGAVAEAGESLTWLDRNGGAKVATARKGTHDTDSRLAPDGLSLALEVAGTDTSPISIWIHDLERDVRTSLTPGIRATFPVWSSDSRRVIARLGTGIEPEGIYVVPVDRSGPPRLLLAEPEGKRLLPMDWSPDGKSLLYVQSASLARLRAADNDLWRLPLDGGDAEPFLVTGASEIDARYSPDGRWVSYASDQTGEYQIYVRPAAGGGEFRVSADGGRDNEWNPAGGELFFLRGRDLYSVDVRADAGRPVSAERLVLTLPATAKPRFLLPAADGRFVTSQIGNIQQANPVQAILNWRRE